MSRSKKMENYKKSRIKNYNIKYSIMHFLIYFSYFFSLLLLFSFHLHTHYRHIHLLGISHSIRLSYHLFSNPLSGLLRSRKDQHFGVICFCGFWRMCLGCCSCCCWGLLKRKGLYRKDFGLLHQLVYLLVILKILSD